MRKREDGKLKAKPSIVLREEFDDYAFLYDPDTGDTFELNTVGVFVWKQLNGRSLTIGQIVELLNSRFDDVPAEAVEHVKEFLGGLSEKGYIE